MQPTVHFHIACKLRTFFIVLHAGRGEAKQWWHGKLREIQISASILTLNKDLPAHLRTDYGGFCAIMTKLSCHHRACMACKAKKTYQDGMHLYRGSVLTAVLSHGSATTVRIKHGNQRGGLQETIGPNPQYSLFHLQKQDFEGGILKRLVPRHWVLLGFMR